MRRRRRDTGSEGMVRQCLTSQHPVGTVPVRVDPGSKAPDAVRTLTIEAVDESLPYREEWDRLAVAADKPYCAPAWMLGWWTDAAPTGARLRLVLVLRGSALIGVAPFFVERKRGLTRYRLLGAGCSSRVDLLSDPGARDVVVREVAEALAHSEPHPDVVLFEGVPAASGWPSLVSRSWPGRRPAVRRLFSQPAPALDLLAPTYEQWLSGKSRNFRQSAQRNDRRMQEAGAVLRLAMTDAELRAGLTAFARLHHERWRGRGGSGVLDPGVERMLVAAGRELLPRGRFQLWTIEVEGRPVAAHVFIAAGRELSYWLGGFDERWGGLQPTFATLLATIRCELQEARRRVDLGTGAQPYKYRFADTEESIEWATLVPPGPRALPARLVLLPLSVRMRAARRAPAGAKRLVRSLQGLVRRPPQHTRARGP
jgi:CelD/BcsL family acetyltransferase involved in cellulose biosynthesis